MVTQSTQRFKSMTSGFYPSCHLYIWVSTITLTFCSLSVVVRGFSDPNDWWWRSKPVCPIGYVEVRGCVPVEGMAYGRGNSAPQQHPNPSNPNTQHPPSSQPPQSSPPPGSSTPNEPKTPPPCPQGYHYSSVFGGCVFDKPKSRTPPRNHPGTPGQPQQPPPPPS